MENITTHSRFKEEVLTVDIKKLGTFEPFNISESVSVEGLYKAIGRFGGVSLVFLEKDLKNSYIPIKWSNYGGTFTFFSEVNIQGDFVSIREYPRDEWQAFSKTTHELIEWVCEPNRGTNTNYSSLRLYEHFVQIDFGDSCRSICKMFDATTHNILQWQVGKESFATFDSSCLKGSLLEIRRGNTCNMFNPVTRTVITWRVGEETFTEYGSSDVDIYEEHRMIKIRFKTKSGDVCYMMFDIDTFDVITWRVGEEIFTDFYDALFLGVNLVEIQGSHESTCQIFDLSTHTVITWRVGEETFTDFYYVDFPKKNLIQIHRDESTCQMFDLSTHAAIEWRVGEETFTEFERSELRSGDRFAEISRLEGFCQMFDLSMHTVITWRLGEETFTEFEWSTDLYGFSKIEIGRDDDERLVFNTTTKCVVG